MSLADDVRDHCEVHYINPARTCGQSTVLIRAGDVHADLGYKNRLPLVCSAIGAQIFEQRCRVQRIGVAGPHTGANTTFTFRL